MPTNVTIRPRMQNSVNSIDRGLALRRPDRVDVPAVDVRDQRRADEDEERHQDAGDRRVEVGQQLLEPEEVPRRLGHGRRDVAVRELLERGVDEQAHRAAGRCSSSPAARNSIESRCGQVMTVSSGSFWTRTTASCLTSASSRYGRADIGTRCLSISVRRVGSTGRTTRDSSVGLASRRSCAQLSRLHVEVIAAR